MKKLVIVQCGGKKIWINNPYLGAVEARDAYTSPYFKKNRAYAERFSDRWVILSAKYGFLDPDDKITDYNVSFKQKKSQPISISDLRNQVFTKALNTFNEVVVLGGQEYLEAVEEAFKGINCKVLSPFEGLKIGERLSALNKVLIS